MKPRYGLTMPMATGRSEWCVFIWRGKRLVGAAYGDDRKGAIAQALKLRRCLQ